MLVNLFFSQLLEAHNMQQHWVNWQLIYGFSLWFPKCVVIMLFLATDGQILSNSVQTLYNDSLSRQVLFKRVISSIWH